VGGKRSNGGRCLGSLGLVWRQEARKKRADAEDKGKEDKKFDSRQKICMLLAKVGPTGKLQTENESTS